MRRMAIAIGAAAAIMVAAGLLYLYFFSAGEGGKANGAAIVAAAHSYTVDLRARNQPIPKAVPLQQLVTLGYLKPGQIAAFHGLDATLFLTANAASPQMVLMRVHMMDGTDLVLLNDGSTSQVPSAR